MIFQAVSRIFYLFSDFFCIILDFGQFWNVSIRSEHVLTSSSSNSLVSDLVPQKLDTPLTAETHVLCVQCMTAAWLNCCVSHVCPHRLCCCCSAANVSRIFLHGVDDHQERWWCDLPLPWFKERKKEKKDRGRKRRKRQLLSPVVYILLMSVTYSTDLHFVSSETLVWRWYDCPQIVFWRFVEEKSKDFWIYNWRVAAACMCVCSNLFTSAPKRIASVPLKQDMCPTCYRSRVTFTFAGLHGPVSNDKYARSG